MKIFDIAIIISFILIIISMIFSIIFINHHTSYVDAKLSQGYVVVKVTDENDNPINNAKVTIIESKTNHITDSFGQTEKISVPLKIDNSFDYIFPKKFGEITIIAKASGFAPHMMYNVKVYPNSTRYSVVIKLKTIINKEDSELIISSEPPSEEYSNHIFNLLP